MDEAKAALVTAWFTKARHDLETANLLAGHPDAHLDVAIYHCQQAAEKSVKGYLAFRDHRLERTHDVERLVQLASTYEPGFEALAPMAILLTPYATAFRYPDEGLDLLPEREEFEQALSAATAMLGFARSLLPHELSESGGKDIQLS